MIRIWCLFLATIALLCSLPACGQDSDRSETSVALYQGVDVDCEVVFPAVLHDRGSYVSLTVTGTDGDVYSPELGERDYLLVESTADENLLKLARKSGFRAKRSLIAVDRSLRVIGDSARCPDLQEAVKNAAEGRDQRRRNVQSRTYRLGSAGITPPLPVFSPQPDDAGSTSHAVLPSSTQSGAKKKVKVEGIVIFAVQIGLNGEVNQSEILRQFFTPVLPGKPEAEVDKKAAALVNTWRFKPARKDGLPVPAAIHVGVQIHLYSYPG